MGATPVLQSPYASAAPALIALGYHPLPIQPASKAPGEFRNGAWRGMTNWQRFRDRMPTEMEQRIWSNNFPEANIGIVLGSPAGDNLFLIAIDLDVEDPDVFDALVRQLPHSPMRKRGLKGETRFYRAPKSIRSKSYNRTADKKRLVDVLTGFDARQTVVPPSFHRDSGLPYVWLAGPVSAQELPIFDDDALAKFEEALGEAGWSAESQRKEIAALPPQDDDDLWTETKTAALANLAAWVPRLGLYNLQRARSGYEAVATWRASSTGQPLEQRKRNLSIQSNGIVDFGDGPKGYSAINLVMAAKDWSQPDATDWLREQLEITTPVVYVPPSRPLKERPALDEMPDDLTRPPGLLGDLTDWIADTSRRPQRGLALGAALTILGTAAGRKYAGPTRTGTHLYVLGVARTSAGKDHPLQQTARVLIAAGMKLHVGPSEFMSLQSVIKRLAKTPLTLCAMDEFGSFLARVNNRKASVYERAISGVLRTAWGKSFQTMSTPEWASQDVDHIQSPAMSIFGVSTPDEFYESLSGADVANGFLNRFLLLSTRLRPPEREPLTDPHRVPEEIILDLNRIYGVRAGLVASTQHNEIADAPLVTLEWGSKAARQIYADFGAAIEERESEIAFLGRTVEISQRLATIRAIGQGVLEISEADMAWGRDLALWSAERMIAECADYMADTQNQAEAQRVIRVLRDGGGEMQHAKLLHAMRHRLKARDLKDIIGALLESGEITESRFTPVTGGPPGKVYRVS